MNNNQNNKHTILFVDDEDKTRKMFEKLVAKDYRVLSADSVAQAKEVLAKEHANISVLVTDQRMPHELGVDLLRYVRKTYPAIIRILTTAYSDIDDAIEAVNAGEIFRYINKPWNVDELLIELRFAVNFFEIEQDKAQLLAEKMSFSHNQSKMETLRYLIANTLSHSNYSNLAFAVSALLEQLHAPHRQFEDDNLENQHNYWQDDIAKTKRFIEIEKHLAEYLDAQPLETDETQPVDIQLCVDRLALNHLIEINSKTNGQVESKVSQQFIERLLSAITKVFANERLTLEVNQDAHNLQMTMHSQNTNSHLIEQLFNANRNADLIGDISAIFVSIYHIGGSVQMQFNHYDLASIAITLPLSKQASAQAVSDTWIEDLFVLYS